MWSNPASSSWPVRLTPSDRPASSPCAAHILPPPRAKHNDNAARFQTCGVFVFSRRLLRKSAPLLRKSWGLSRENPPLFSVPRASSELPVYEICKEVHLIRQNTARGAAALLRFGQKEEAQFLTPVDFQRQGAVETHMAHEIRLVDGGLRVEGTPFVEAVADVVVDREVAHTEGG